SPPRDVFQVFRSRGRRNCGPNASTARTTAFPVMVRSEHPLPITSIERFSAPSEQHHQPLVADAGTTNGLAASLSNLASVRFVAGDLVGPLGDIASNLEDRSIRYVD